MKQTLYMAIAAAVALATLGACKTSEANYRAAYERALTGRDSLSSLENTIYGSGRRAMGATVVVAGSDSAMRRTARVIVTEGGGGIRENLRPYSVIVGQFKQKFNAVSMRERLADGGYPQAFVVENSEPYYYVVLGSYTNQAEAIAAVAALKDRELPVAVKEPCPFILQCPR